MTTSKHMWKAIRFLFLSCLLTFCAKAQATITLNVTSPTAGALAGSNLHIVVASVTSTYQVQSVTATVAGRQTNLTFDATAGWIGDLSLAGLPRGPQTLSLNATDVFANSGQTQLSFVHDQPPVLTVLEPTLPIFTHPQLHVVANATDDDPVGVVIRVYTQGRKFFEKVVLATATNSLDTFADLSIISPDPWWDGYYRELDFEATDSAGQITTTPAYVYIVRNTNVVEVDRVSGPIIFDVSAVAILFANGTALKSKSRINGAEQVLVNRPDLGSVAGSFLTAHGAIFSTSLGKVYEIRDGTLIDLGAGGGNLVVKGNYAIWITATNSTITLTLRDLLAGTNVVISTDAANYGSDVADNGDVVYSGDSYSVYNVYRYRHGTRTQVGNGLYPVTDGINVGYFTMSSFALFDGTNEIILGPQPQNPNSRSVSGGWTAYIKPGTGQNQVWTRSPNGVQTQRTFFGSSSDLYGLGPSGDLMTYLYSGGGRLYFIPNGSPPTDLGPWSFGPPFWIKGNWYASLGSSLVAFVVPSAPAISSFGWNTNGQFSFHIEAGLGQQVVTQESTDVFNWTSLTTNFVTSTFGIDVAFPASGSNKKFYRVISVH